MTAIIVQARMTSVRLPGKVLAPILERPMLDFQLERLQAVRTPHVTVVATTVNVADDPVERVARARGCVVLRGSEDDVLDRYARAAALVDAEVVVRVTADCPLIDPDVIAVVLARFAQGGCDYASNTLRRTYPRGLDVEALGRSVLDLADREASSPADREHVTRFVYRQPSRFRLCGVESSQDLATDRWTVDTLEDLDLVTRIIEALYPTRPDFRMADVLRVLAANPTWRTINADVRQKHD